jgi:glucose/arabinose dehydrogenase
MVIHFTHILMKKIVLVFFYLVTCIFSDAQTLPGTYTKTATVTGLLYPSDFDWLPDGRYIVTQKGGATNTTANALIRLFKSDGSAIGTFYNLTDSVDANGEHGLHGIAVDPDFENNHFIYAYYTYINKAKTVKALRVVRFTEVSDVGTNPTLIFNHIYTATTTNHVGGIIRIRPSEPTKLYIQIGELAYEQTDPSKNYANKLTNPYGKILRINTDGSIPKDNPFYDDGNPATGNDDRIWSYGHRNCFGMCFNPVTDSMYSSENGLNAWDEFNVIHKGGNYGWATCEGEYLNSSTSKPCTDPSLIKPIATWGAPLPSVTGCVYYSGTVMPEFNNHILVADNDYGILYDLTMGNAPAYDVVTNKKNFADIVSGSNGTGLTTLRQGADGCIYALKGGYTSSGEIYRICPTSLGIHSTEEPVNAIEQNYPNPVADKTRIDYTIALPSHVKISLLDVTGRIIRIMMDKNVQQGKHTLEIDALSTLPNGSYFYRMDVNQTDQQHFSQTKRMVVIN